MSKAKITKPIDPRLSRPSQCRSCGEWYELVGARSAIFCSTCAEKRQERLRRAAEDAERYAAEDEETARQIAAEQMRQKE